MRFIITAQAGTSETKADGDFDMNTLIAHMKFNEELHKAGVLVASEGLNPAAAGARVGLKDGKRVLIDGPFAESKELVGGFYIFEVNSLDEAIQWALRCPAGFGGSDVLEIRQLTGEEDLPPEILSIISSAAPTWSASFRARAKTTA